MADFKPDCTINLHVEARGKPAKLAWSCSVSHARSGRLALARRFIGLSSREETELRALLFGLRQASRLLQEKVEVAATFGLDGRLDDSRRVPPELKPLRDEAHRLWEGFRYRRIGKLSPAVSRELGEEAEKAYRRRREG
jgi:hypothetical protein